MGGAGPGVGGAWNLPPRSRLGSESKALAGGGVHTPHLMGWGSWRGLCYEGWGAGEGSGSSIQLMVQALF